jgi:phosphatidylglycerol:prolipoprotein diacylglycerol transferase
MFAQFPGNPWITPYGVMLTLACIAAWWIARRRAVAVGIDASHLDLALPLAFVGGGLFAGALAWVLPSERLLAGGLLLTEERRRLYAVSFVVLPILFVYCRASGLSFRRLSDVVAIPALVFMAVIRIGCFLAGCCFGDVSGHAQRLAQAADPALRLQLQTVGWLSSRDMPWAVRFPAGSFAWRQHQALGLLEPGATSSLPVHPVQLYETVLLTLLCLALVRLRRSFTKPGGEALVVLASYAVIEFLLEFLRADNALVLGPLTLNQLICLGWLAIAVALAAALPSSTAPGKAALAR